MIVVLAGGVGGSKFIKGLSLSSQEDIVAIINTGDDIERFGLYISPDIDINIYSLANVIHEQGWGFKDETYACQNILSKIYNEECWFNLGDRDIATHIYRTHLMKTGKTLSEITSSMCNKWGIPIRIYPMTNDQVTTYIESPEGSFHFQEYLIKRRMSDHVVGINFKGIETAKPTPGILEKIASADMILFAPSNPLVSIHPILSVPGIKNAIKDAKAKIVAVSPIIGGNVIKGPLYQMMTSLDMEVSPCGLASFYHDIIDGIVIDQQDSQYTKVLQENYQLKVLVTDILMNSEHKKTVLANEVVEWVKKF